MITRYRSHGKLLLSGEYLVLHGAKALAIPVKYSQWADVCQLTGKVLPVIKWQAKNMEKFWFSAVYDKNNLNITDTNDQHKADILRNILREAQKLNGRFLNTCHSYHVATDTDFPVNWGLGTSSTLIANIARWARVDPFALFFNTSDGSGFDVACTQSDSPIIYEVKDKKPVYTKVEFFPEFHDKIYFVYLGKKQDSGKSIKDFLIKIRPDDSLIKSVNQITDSMLGVSGIIEFEKAICDHERIISTLIERKSVKQELFPDFKGEIKSLGAWGGDFVMVTWTGTLNGLKKYFFAKGLRTIIPFKEMIL